MLIWIATSGEYISFGEENNSWSYIVTPYIGNYLNKFTLNTDRITIISFAFLSLCHFKLKNFIMRYHLARHFDYTMVVFNKRLGMMMMLFNTGVYLSTVIGSITRMIAVAMPSKAHRLSCSCTTIILLVISVMSLFYSLLYFPGK